MVLSRRDVLRTGVLIATVTGGVGVTAATGERGRRGPMGDDPSLPTQQIPAYADWIPDPEAFPQLSHDFASAVDVGAVLEAEEDHEAVPRDYMLINPALYGRPAIQGWIELIDNGISEPIIGPADPTQTADPADAPATTQLFLGETLVYLGSFDLGAVEDAVTSGPYSVFEDDDVGDGFYEHEDRTSVDRHFVTWTGGAVAFGNAPRDIETVVDAGTGDVARRYEVDDDYGRLLALADDDFALLWQLIPDLGIRSYELGAGQSPASYEMFQDTLGFVQTATVEDTLFRSAATRATWADADEVDPDQLTEGLGAEASDLSTDVTDRSVTLRATYDRATEAATARPTTTALSDGAGDGSGDGDAEGETDGDGAGSGDDGSGGDGSSGDGSGGDDPDEGPGEFGPGMGPAAAVAALLGGGYLLDRRRDGEA